MYYLGSMKPLSDRTVTELQRHLAKPQKKEKASVSISGEVLAAVDTLAGKTGRSAFVERAIRNYLGRAIRRHINQKDLELINAHAPAINRESDWILEVQAWPE